MLTMFICLIISHLLFGLGIATIEYAKVEGDVVPFSSKWEFFLGFSIMGYLLIVLYVANYVTTRKVS